MWQVDDVTIAASTSGHPQILGLGTMHTLSRHNLGTMHDPRTRQINARFILNEKVKRSRLVAAKQSVFLCFLFSLALLFHFYIANHC